MKTPQRIGAVIAGVLKQTAERQRAIRLLQRRWVAVAGRPLAAHTQPVSLRRGRLVVVAEQPGDGFALQYRRAQLLERVRKLVGESIEELVIRPGAAKPARRRRSARCHT